MDWSIILLALAYLGILVGLTWWLQRYHCTRFSLDNPDEQPEPEANDEFKSDEAEELIEIEEFNEDEFADEAIPDEAFADDSEADDEVCVKIAVPKIEESDKA